MCWGRTFAGVLALTGCMVFTMAELAPAQCEVAKLLASDGSAYDLFGTAVAISGRAAVVGAAWDINENGYHSGSAYVFSHDGSSWVEERKLLPSDGAASDHFGCCVAFSGDTAVIGAEAHGSCGAAYVFQYDGVGWVQVAKLLASDGAADDKFGGSVAVDGDTIVAGAPGDDSARGAAYFFTRPPGGWVTATETGKLLASDGAPGDRFGGYLSVAVADDTILVGASAADALAEQSGAAYMFRYDGLNWIEEKLVASDGAAGDYFGRSVAVDGNTALIGAYGGDGCGSGYVFELDGGAWQQSAKLTASDRAPDDRFGYTVALSAGTALVGAFRDDDSGTDSGSVHVFEKPLAGWMDMTETHKLLASDGDADDFFGETVTMDGDTALVGAHNDEENGSQSGSAYLFSLAERPALVAVDPGANGSLPKTDYNVIRLTFCSPITLPPAGNALMMTELTDPNNDVSDLFTYTIDAAEPTGATLKATEVGSALTNQTWLRVASAPAWPDVVPFAFDVYTLHGDANNSGRVTTADYSVVKANMGHRAPTKP